MSCFAEVGWRGCEQLHKLHRLRRELSGGRGDSSEQAAVCLQVWCSLSAAELISTEMTLMMSSDDVPNRCSRAVPGLGRKGRFSQEEAHIGSVMQHRVGPDVDEYLLSL